MYSVICIICFTVNFYRSNLHFNKYTQGHSVSHRQTTSGTKKMVPKRGKCYILSLRLVFIEGCCWCETCTSYSESLQWHDKSQCSVLLSEKKQLICASVCVHSGPLVAELQYCSVSPLGPRWPNCHTILWKSWDSWNSRHPRVQWHRRSQRNEGRSRWAFTGQGVIRHIYSIYAHVFKMITWL